MNEQTEIEPTKNIKKLGKINRSVIKITHPSISGKKERNGDDSGTGNALFPACEAVDCHKALFELIKYRSTTDKPLTAISAASLIDEDAEDSAIRAQFCPLAYAGCFTASIRFRARIPLISITARNFDHTLFSTASNGTRNHQTIYYPAESDQIFGACDCLRFRNIHKPCEHLSVIALSVLFASNPNSAQEIRDQIQEIYPAERYAEPLPAGNDP